MARPPLVGAAATSRVDQGMQMTTGSLKDTFFSIKTNEFDVISEITCIGPRESENEYKFFLSFSLSLNDSSLPIPPFSHTQREQAAS